MTVTYTQLRAHETKASSYAVFCLKKKKEKKKREKERRGRWWSDVGEVSERGSEKKGKAAGGCDEEKVVEGEGSK